MGEIVSMNESGIERPVHAEGNDLVEITNGILFDARADLKSKEVVSMPIAGLAGLGAGIASLLPAMRTVTQSTSFNTDGLFRLADAKVGDALKAARDGNFWGAKTTAEGASKLAKFQSVDELTATTTNVMPINPATMMMAVALFSIEQQLDNITEMEKQILSFLENEKEAEIEADVEMLVDLIKKYKLNWNNEHFVASNHKIVLDIQGMPADEIRVEAYLELLSGFNGIVLPNVDHRPLERVDKLYEEKRKIAQLECIFSCMILDYMSGGMSLSIIFPSAGS